MKSTVKALRRISIPMVYLLLLGIILLCSFFIAHPSYAEGDTPDAVIPISPSDDPELNRKNIQRELDKANASGDQLHIFLEAGEYKVNGILNIYGNTFLELDGNAVIKRTGGDHVTSMLNTTFPKTSPGYTRAQNIRIKGGTWDSSESKKGCIFHFSHSQGISIEDTTLKGCRSSHVIILDAVKDASICNVKFENDIPDSSYNSGSRRYVNEAIHIDSAASGRPASDEVPAEADGTPCSNITVDGCTFNGVCNAVGAHFHAKGEKTHTNINVINNTFQRIEAGSTIVTAAQSNNWVVENNIAKNSGAGIFARLNGCSNFKISNNTVSNVDSFVEDNGIANALRSNGTLSGNTVTGIRKNAFLSYQSNSSFSFNNESYTTTMTGYSSQLKDNKLIYIEGKHYSDAPSNATIQNCTFTFSGTPTVPSSVNYLTGIHLSNGKFIFKNNNVSSSPGAALFIKQATRATRIENNTFSSCGGSRSNRVGTDGYTIILESTNGITVTNNKLNSCKFGGIYLNGSSENTVTYNTIAYPNTNSSIWCKGYPVLLYSKAKSNTITNNTFNGNANVKTSADSTGNTIKSNTLNTTKPSWSGASKMPTNSTATYTVKNGSIKVKSGGTYISVSGNKVTAKKKGSGTLALLDKNGKEYATKKVTVYDLSGEYIMQSSINSNYVLDIRGKSKKNSAQMIVWTKNGGNNQKYVFQKKSGGSYAIKCVHSGKYVDVQGGGTKKSQKVIQYSWKDGTNQKWKISVDAKNQVTFLNLKSGMAFDVRGGKAAKGKEMIQYPYNGRNNQKWVLVKAN